MDPVILSVDRCESIVRPVQPEKENYVPVVGYMVKTLHCSCSEVIEHVIVRLKESLNMKMTAISGRLSAAGFFDESDESAHTRKMPRSGMCKQLLFLLLSSMVLFGGCKGDSGKTIGAACDEDTVCKDVCLLSLPGGMCSKPCEEGRSCKSGECVKISGGYYCVPSCEQDTDCRFDEGYLCVLGGCRPLVMQGEPCGKHDDCGQGTVCVGGQCGVACLDSSVCDDGYYCLEEEGRTGCAPDDCSSGVCNRKCTVHADCSFATYCGDDGFCVPDKCDENGICDHPCAEHVDCPNGTYCALVAGEKRCVFLPEDKGPGTTGHGCSDEPCAEGYVCIKSGNQDAYAYCTEECDQDMDCLPGMFCGETMISGGVLVDLCLQRLFCEPCEFDGQCRYFDDKCVSAEGALGGEGYCSAVCDPTAPDTCPVDNTCLQAFFCESSGLWVADCEDCSGNCEGGEEDFYQCFHDFGACVGEGDLCSPCKHSGHCDLGGDCLTMSTNGLKFCSAPCDENDRCPLGYWCAEVTGLGMQCVPRKASCTEPSGNRAMCDLCEGLDDCMSGSCVAVGWSNFCFDECTPGLDDCPPYTGCEEVRDIYGLDWNLCRPQGDVDDCTKFNRCMDHCPGGPDSCDGNEPSYCR